jgi:hypothetical protein
MKKTSKIHRPHAPKRLEKRKMLELKVEAGTKKAIKDYGEVFRRLAAYDKA